MTLLHCMGVNSSNRIQDFATEFVNLNYTDLVTGGPNGSNYLQIHGYAICSYQVFGDGLNPHPVVAGREGRLGFRYSRYSDNIFYLTLIDPTGKNHIGLQIDGLGQIKITRCDNTDPRPNYVDAILYNGPPGQVPNVFSYIELGWTISATAGKIILKIDNTIVFNQTGLNTKGLTTTSDDTYGYYTFGYGNYLDLYTADTTGPAPANDFFGDIRVFDMIPNGAGNVTQFTPTGAGSNWQVAATTPPDAVNVYNSATAVGAKDLYTLTTPPAGFDKIFGVKIKAHVSKTDAGNRGLGLIIKSHATETVGVTHNLGLVDSVYTDIFQVDPGTGLAFTRADLLQLQVGQVIIS